jgi:hypothetical protein
MSGKEDPMGDLSSLLKEQKETEQQLQVLEAMGRIVERTPGATTLEDAQQATGRLGSTSWSLRRGSRPRRSSRPQPGSPPVMPADCVQAVRGIGLQRRWRADSGS